MTATLTTTAQVAPAAASTADAEKVLRDVAFVLKLTRRVKEEMTADRASARVKATAAERALVA